MDDKTFREISFVLYPVFVFLTVIISILVYTYFLPERGKTSKRSIDYKIRK